MIRLRMRTVAGAELGELTLDKFPAVVGRDPSCEVVIGEAGVSTRHAEISWDGEWLIVRDLGSRNGTTVGKEKVTQAQLELPCIVTVGNVATITFEEVVAQTAVAVRPMPPKAFRRPEPPATVVYAEPELVKKVIEVEEAVVIEGWELYWHMVKNQKPRPVLLAMIGLAFLYAILNQLVFRESFLFSLGVGCGAAAASAVIAVITAGISAVPGILFRGKYDFKPLYIQQCLGTMVLSFYAGILRPAFLMEYFGYVAQAISLPLVAVCSVAGCYMWFFNTFSHKHERRLMVIAMIFAALAVLGESRSVLSVDRQELLREALMGKFRTARGLAGSSTEVKSVTEDIREFGRKFPVK